MKESILNDILARTDGDILYREQYYQICLQLLRLDRKSSDDMIKAYTDKNIEEMNEWNSFIEDVVGEKELSEKIVFLFSFNIFYAQYEFLTRLKEQNYNMLIDNVLKNTDGLLLFYYQAVMILTDVFQFKEHQVSTIINNYKLESNWAIEKEYLFTKMENLPSILDRVHTLLSHSANHLQSNIPILNFD